MPLIASHARKGYLAYVGLPVTFAVWAAAAHSGLVDTTLLPPPERVIQAVRDIGPALWLHIFATTARVIAGFTLSVAIGAALALLMQANRRVYELCDGLVETWRPVPPVALVPFFLLIFGFSETGRMILVTLGGALVATVTVIEALDASPRALVRLCLLYRLSKARAYLLVLIPAAAPKLVGGFRVTLALVFSLVIVSEFLGSRYGLGYLISVAKVTLTTSTMLLCILALGLIGLVADGLLRLAFRRISAWQPSARDEL